MYHRAALSGKITMSLQTHIYIQKHQSWISHSLKRQSATHWPQGKTFPNTEANKPEGTSPLQDLNVVL